ILVSSTRYWDQKTFIFAVFFASNISSVNLVLARLRSYEGITKVESFVTTNVSYHLDWLRIEIDKKKAAIKNHLISSTSAAAATHFHRAANR
ncbi:MAG: hypothetical protein JO327_11490, partial [Nitrososphaeraceae archaeon]|nr:hypothetical protein [Nitrososphaeraceae archaeon]